jgi:hypothetical protein
MNNVKEDLNRGLVYLPYVLKTGSTSINGVTVWHSNKFINFWIKIKHFFYKPKVLRDIKKYANKPVNTKYYKNITVDKDEQTR